MKNRNSKALTQPAPRRCAPVSCSVRSREDDLRIKLYKAATEYGQYIVGDEIDYDKAMRVAGELESAADAFAER